MTVYWCGDLCLRYIISCVPDDFDDDTNDNDDGDANDDDDGEGNNENLGSSPKFWGESSACCVPNPDQGALVACRC